MGGCDCALLRIWGLIWTILELSVYKLKKLYKSMVTNEQNWGRGHCLPPATFHFFFKSGVEWAIWQKMT